MKKLLVFLEINGKKIYVGDIQYNNVQDASFAYVNEYLELPEAAPISISLPLQSERFSPHKTKTFFEGLLPEGFTRRTVAQWMHVSEEDYLSILVGLGNECLGAIRVSEESEAPSFTKYERLNEKQIAELAAEGATKSAEMVTKTHLSLTGASGKVGLYYAEDTKQWFMPYGEAPSTHIVKQSHVRLDSIVTNEQLCLLTGKKLGLEIPDSFIINTGKANDGEVLFATKRYDRQITENAEALNGLKIPLRLHQEDFAQALGISAAEKYEKENKGYLQQMFQILFKYADNPIKEQTRLWNILIYDFLVGNTDNHIKNLSLLYGQNLKGLQLAPAYDIISTTVYESSTRDMGIMIGNKLCIDDIKEESFYVEAQKVGINEKIVIRRFEDIASKFENALRETAYELEHQGFSSAKSLCEKILKSGGFSKK